MTWLTVHFEDIATIVIGSALVVIVVVALICLLLSGDDIES